jgi:hypothetical protein
MLSVLRRFTTPIISLYNVAWNFLHIHCPDRDTKYVINYYRPDKFFACSFVIGDTNELSGFRLRMISGNRQRKTIGAIPHSDPEAGAWMSVTKK